MYVTFLKQCQTHRMPLPPEVYSFDCFLSQLFIGRDVYFYFPLAENCDSKEALVCTLGVWQSVSECHWDVVGRMRREEIVRKVEKSRGKGKGSAIESSSVLSSTHLCPKFPANRTNVRIHTSSLQQNVF